MIDPADLYYPTGQLRMNLFHEFNGQRHEDYPPIYTLRETEFRGLPSAYQIYMESNTEYDAAQAIFGSWSIWNRYAEQTDFANALKGWREEKKLQEESKARQQLLEAAEMGSVPAMKAIWDSHHKEQKGRPSAKQVEAAAKREAASQKKVKEDLKRLKLVNG